VRTIARQWEMFRAAVVSPNAPPEQVREMKIAFYGGFSGAQAEYMQIAADDLSEEAAMGVMTGFTQEAAEFAAQLAREWKGSL
jgi:hypothetical protein